MIGYITWIVFINIALWRIRGDDDDFGMDEGDECDYMYVCGKTDIYVSYMVIIILHIHLGSLKISMN